MAAQQGPPSLYPAEQDLAIQQAGMGQSPDKLFFVFVHNMAQ